jgi:hypothetical protein
MIDDPIRLKEALDDLGHKARSLPPDKFLEHVDHIVEESRKHIEASKDERIRESLLEFYQVIIRYAFACQLQALSPKHSGIKCSGVSACC